MNLIDRLALTLLRTLLWMRRRLRRFLRRDRPAVTDSQLDALWADLDAAMRRKFGDE